MTSMALSSRKGLDAQHLQRDFRWATPLRLVMQYLVARDDGTDKLYGKWQRPTAQAPFVEPNELDDDFLEQVARDYLDAGTRYSRVLADKYGVAPRSVIRWIDLARSAGLLADRIRPAGGRGPHRAQAQPQAVTPPAPAGQPVSRSGRRAPTG